MENEMNMPGRTNPARTIDPHEQKQTVEVPQSMETNATNVIPDEVPRRDGPGGE